MSTNLTWSDSPIHNELAAWELLKEARRERDEAREGWLDEIQKGQAELRKAEQLYNNAIRERDEAREQRDRLADQLDDAVAEATNAVNDIIGMKWQRDMLAEALQKVVTAWDFAEWLDENDFESFRTALQSLTPNEL
jgi:chromosome segregation ATPase